MGCLGGARLSRAPTVPATWGSPRSSRMCRGRHNWLYRDRNHRRRNTAGQKKTTEMRVNGWKIKPKEKIRITMATQEKWGAATSTEKRNMKQWRRRTGEKPTESLREVLTDTQSPAASLCLFMLRHHTHSSSPSSSSLLLLFFSIKNMRHHRKFTTSQLEGSTAEPSTGSPHVSTAFYKLDQVQQTPIKLCSLSTNSSVTEHKPGPVTHRHGERRTVETKSELQTTEKWSDRFLLGH